MNITCVLPAESHYRFPHDGRWRLRCVQGCLWVTQADGGRDHVLQTGDERVFEAGANVLMGALQDSQIELECLSVSPLHRVSAWQARWALMLRRWWQQPSSVGIKGTAADNHFLSPQKESNCAGRSVCGAFCEELD
ncbi:MAG: DUF2917 domain-containing protein [Moraxellaceae bacterium]